MTLRLNNASFAYVPHKPILREVSASFALGRVTVVAGPNGAGKSTLLRLLAGLRGMEARSVLLGDSPLDGLSRGERSRRLVYLPQNSSVAFDYTACEVVAMGLYSQGGIGDRAHALSALARVGLQDSGDELFRTLSAGQQQRVTLARAIAQLGSGPHSGACYLLADEPVSAMDPRHALGSMEILRSLSRGGIGVVVVLHDLSLAMQYADDALLLGNDGRIAAFGPSGEVIRGKHLEALFGLKFEELVDSKGRPAAIIPAV